MSLNCRGTRKFKSGKANCRYLRKNWCKCDNISHAFFRRVSHEVKIHHDPKAAYKVTNTDIWFITSYRVFPDAGQIIKQANIWETRKVYETRDQIQNYFISKAQALIQNMKEVYLYQIPAKDVFEDPWRVRIR